MPIRKFTFAAVIALLLGIVVAGCGDSSSDSGSTSGGTTATTGSSTTAADTSNLSGDPLRVGIVCACSGPAAGTAGGLPKLVDAWEKSTNAGGGINGHPVKAILVDTKNDPATTITQVKKLIDQDKVQALVDADYQAAAYAPLAQKAGIPITGGNYADQVFLSSPIFFPSGTTVPGLYYGMLNEAKAQGKSKVAVLACAELPPCAGVGGLMKAFAAVVGGISVVSESKVAATAPNYTAQCVQAKNAGADVQFVAHSSDVVVRVADQCAQQGWKPTVISYTSIVSNNWLKDPNLNGAVTAQGTAPLGTNDTAGMQRFNSAMEKYAADYRQSDQFGEVSIDIWSGLELFRKAAENVKLDGSGTGADVQKGLYSMKGETLGGLAPPLTFTKGKPTVIVPCYFTQGVEDGKFTAPNGSKPTCIPAAAQAKLGQALAAAAG